MRIDTNQKPFATLGSGLNPSSYPSSTFSLLCQSFVPRLYLHSSLPIFCLYIPFIIYIQYILSLLKRLILKRDPTRNEMAITPAGRAPMFITVYSIIMGLSTIFVFLRLYTRAVIVKNLGADDYFAAISWVSPPEYCVYSYCNMRDGTDWLLR